MLLMSNLVNYERLFKDSIEIPQIMPQIMPGIIFLNKMLSEHSQCVAFTPMSMKRVIKIDICWAEICHSHNNNRTNTDNYTVKTTPAIFVIEFSASSFNDTARGQWWWQLITLECQQQFLGIWAAVPQSILDCSSSGGGKRATEMRILCFSGYWKMRQ